MAKTESKFMVLQRYLSENGVKVDGIDLSLPSTETIATRPLDDESLERDLGSLRTRYREALQQISLLTSELNRSRSRVEQANPNQQELVEELRQALTDSEKAHQERMRQMETDYQTAIHYVK